MWNGMTVAMQQNGGAYIFLSHSSSMHTGWMRRGFLFIFAFLQAIRRHLKQAGFLLKVSFLPQGQTVKLFNGHPEYVVEVLRWQVPLKWEELPIHVINWILKLYKFILIFGKFKKEFSWKTITFGVILSLYNFLSSVEHNRRYFEKCSHCTCNEDEWWTGYQGQKVA